MIRKRSKHERDQLEVDRCVQELLWMELKYIAESNDFGAYLCRRKIRDHQDRHDREYHPGLNDQVVADTCSSK